MAFEYGPVAQARAADPNPSLAQGTTGSTPVRKRVPLGRSRQRLSYELRLRLALLALAVPVVASVNLLVWSRSQSLAFALGTVALTAVLLAICLASLFEALTRPLQTLANVVAALREDDFSFRARGGRRGDALGDLALEVNALASTLQNQRTQARDALSLAERVMDAMRTPVLAFASDGKLRLLNPAAERAFALSRRTALGHTAQALGLEQLFVLSDGAIHTHPAVSGIAGETRWSLRRSSFRLGGLPHELFVLSDVQAALLEEERIAWQRLIRVLSHEINNSLTPITSLAGSLRVLLADGSENTGPATKTSHAPDLRRGLYLIEERALSLHRFLQAYQQLTRLPRPSLQYIALVPLLQRVASLETRVPVHLRPGPDLSVPIDPAQIEHLLINLVHNAAEAAMSLSLPDHPAQVILAWSANSGEWILQVEDNGPGLTDTANLFVPFYTTKPTGSGIGLALAKQIAVGHRGTLSLANKGEGRGCIAELRLPMRGQDLAQTLTMPTDRPS